ncbi:MAG: hypothetical protein Sw2LagTSB_02870 [Shewanella algae]
MTRNNDTMPTIFWHDYETQNHKALIKIRFLKASLSKMYSPMYTTLICHLYRPFVSWDSARLPPIFLNLHLQLIIGK